MRNSDVTFMFSRFDAYFSKPNLFKGFKFNPELRQHEARISGVEVRIYPVHYYLESLLATDPGELARRFDTYDRDVEFPSFTLRVHTRHTDLSELKSFTCCPVPSRRFTPSESEILDMISFLLFLSRKCGSHRDEADLIAGYLKYVGRHNK
jgi:hypothetical protein